MGRVQELAENTELTEAEAERVVELESGTLLSHREAEVHTLKEQGLERSEIAEQLDISPPTVDEYERRIWEKVEKAGSTVRTLRNVPGLKDAYFEWKTGHAPEKTLKDYIEAVAPRAFAVLEETDGWGEFCEQRNISWGVLGMTYEEAKEREVESQ